VGGDEVRTQTADRLFEYRFDIPLADLRDAQEVFIHRLMGSELTPEL
jgi:hypothetical protein